MSWKAACPVGDVKQDKIKECTIDGVEIILVNVGDGFRAYPPYVRTWNSIWKALEFVPIMS